MGWVKGTPKERLRKMSQWHPVTGCLEMKKSLDNCGYGRFRFNGKAILAHRASYEIYNGVAPGKMDVLHSCDNPRCVNPMHLSLGTHDDNMRDMARKGRAFKNQGEKHPGAKLSNEKAFEIRWYSAMGYSHPVIAAMYGVTRQLISGIVRDEQWSPENHD